MMTEDHPQLQTITKYGQFKTKGITVSSIDMHGLTRETLGLPSLPHTHTRKTHTHTHTHTRTRTHAHPTTNPHSFDSCADYTPHTSVNKVHPGMSGMTPCTASTCYF